MNFIEIENLLWSGIVFLAFLFTCSTLIESRFGKKESVFISAGFLTAVIILQAQMIIFGQDQTLILTMLPLTAYLPIIIAVHILSKSRFFQASAIWFVGLLVSYTLVILQKIFLFYIPMSGGTNRFLYTMCLLLSLCLLLFIVVYYIRKPFRSYVLHNHTNWLPLCFPSVMVFVLFSYFKNSTTNFTVWFLLFLTALSVFLVIARSLVSIATVIRMKESEKVVLAQLAIQRKEYEDICKKMEVGRAYRHDMRHHLTVISSLASVENNKEIMQYISDLDGKIKETEQETYCENSTVNAVLCSYIGQAKKEGCTVTAKVKIPCEFPFDDLDICAILANALENAINACQNSSTAEDRTIELTAYFGEDRKFIVSISNPCKKRLQFDKDGLPVVPKRDGHGIGLKSIKMMAEKYNGLFECDCIDGIFQLRTVLFDSQEPPIQPKKILRPRKALVATLMSLLVFCFAANCIPSVQALTKTPIWDRIIRVVDFRSYKLGWGDTEINLDLPKMEETPTDDTSQTKLSVEKPIVETSKEQSEPQEIPEPQNKSKEIKIPTLQNGTISWSSEEVPNNTPSVPKLPEVLPQPSTPPAPEKNPTPPTPEKPPDSSEGIEDINKNMAEYIKSMRDKFLWYVARKYNGYVAMDSTYTTLRNDDRLFIIRFDTTLNVGGSGSFSRCFILNKQSGKMVELWDLFKQNSDYMGIISKEILRQMTEQVNAGLGDYFIPGGIWPPEDWFKKIAADQNFYINNRNQLVIVFDKYEVAPGKAGMPEFTIHTDILKSILRQPSVLN